MNKLMQQASIIDQILSFMDMMCSFVRHYVHSGETVYSILRVRNAAKEIMSCCDRWLELEGVKDGNEAKE